MLRCVRRDGRWLETTNCCAWPVGGHRFVKHTFSCLEKVQFCSWTLDNDQFMMNIKGFELAACHFWPTFSRRGSVSFQALPWPPACNWSFTPLSGSPWMELYSNNSPESKSTNILHFRQLFFKTSTHTHIHTLTHVSLWSCEPHVPHLGWLG